MNNIQHKVQINIAGPEGRRQMVVSGKTVRIPCRILELIFGKLTEVMLITPGKTVVGIEVKEVENGGGYIEEDR